MAEELMHPIRDVTFIIAVTNFFEWKGLYIYWCASDIDPSVFHRGEALGGMDADSNTSVGEPSVRKRPSSQSSASLALEDQATTLQEEDFTWWVGVVLGMDTAR